MLTLRTPDADERWCTRLRTDVGDELLELGLPGLTINVRDDAVRAAVLTLTTLDPPVVAVVTMWTQQCYGEQIRAAFDLLRGESAELAGYLVTESVPLAPPDDEIGRRTPGLANIALLRRPPELDPETWRHRWHIDHTPVALQTQATVGYLQNAVVRALTDDAPVVDAIVEELFPIEAVTDLHAFFGAADDEDLAARMRRMLASTEAFGANRDIDTVPTSRYPLRTPFGSR